MKHIKNKNTVKIEDMSLYEMCRWSALIDCMEIAEEKCQEKRINYEDLDVNHKDIMDYVDAITDDLFYKVSTNK